MGTNGSLTYRLNLDGFPAIAWAVTYFAEIEDLSPIESSCCRPPSECGYPAVNASYYDLSFHPVSPNHDCKRYKKILELSNAIVVILARPAWRNTWKLSGELLRYSMSYYFLFCLSYTLLDAMRDEVRQGAKLSIEEESIYACIHELLLNFVGREKKDQCLQLKMNLWNSY